jgi:siroheme synthase
MELVTHGRDATTPAAAAVQWGTTDRAAGDRGAAHRPRGPGALAVMDAVAAAGLGAPATIVVGDVVGMRAVLAAEPALVGAA